MLRTRLWMGAILIALALGVLFVDQQFAPWYPFLLVLVLTLALGACYELVQLLGPARRLPTGLCLAGVAVVILANWVGHTFMVRSESEPQPWVWVAGAFAGVV